MKTASRLRNTTDRRRTGLRRVGCTLAAAAALAILGGATPAAADEYEDTYSGHPLRVLGYVMHPVGVILDYLIFRPAHWLVSQGSPLKTLFGHKD
jgi:hypothetical protein